MNTSSKHSLIALLHFMRDRELDKPREEFDEGLFEACVKLLLVLQGKEITNTTEQIEEKVRNIPVVLSADFTGETTKKVKKYTTKKKILLVAAIIAILCAFLAVFSIGYNLDYWHSVMNEKFGSVFNVPVGEKYVEENKEFIHTGVSVFYEDIDDFRKNEKTNVLLPSELPDDISLTRIQISEAENKIYVSFNNVITSYEININTQLQKELSINSESYTTDNGILCYIKKIDGTDIVQIYFEYNGNTYTIGGTDRQTLLDIINDLEEQE